MIIGSHSKHEHKRDYLIGRMEMMDDFTWDENCDSYQFGDIVTEDEKDAYHEVNRITNHFTMD